ncbi:6-phosphogluconate dehydrogenase NAD-binding protein [Actinobacteria bacterium OK074]|nr:6-phosphogluconate dehydrogenase NAD-binding protein [Actinobacteria bacterium OK074]
MSAPGPIRTVALLGAGLMAHALAPRLRGEDRVLRLYNRTPARAERMAGPGDTVCLTPADAATGADAVLSLVTDDDASAAVWFGDHGALRGTRPGTVALECSTLSPRYTDTWARRCRAAGALPVDCAVTGSTPRAAEGTLIGFAGAEDDALSAARPLLAVFTERIVHFGPPGAGMRYKLVHNLAAATALVGLAESLRLGETLGLNPSDVVHTLADIGWAAPVAQSKAAAMVSGDHTDVMCSVANLSKDVRYACQAAAESGVRLPVAHGVGEQFAAAVRAGAGDLDMGAVRLASG